MHQVPVYLTKHTLSSPAPSATLKIGRPLPTHSGPYWPLGRRWLPWLKLWSGPKLPSGRMKTAGLPKAMS